MYLQKDNTQANKNRNLDHSGLHLENVISY